MEFIVIVYEPVDKTKTKTVKEDGAPLYPGWPIGPGIIAIKAFKTHDEAGDWVSKIEVLGGDYSFGPNAEHVILKYQGSFARDSLDKLKKAVEYQLCDNK